MLSKYYKYLPWVILAAFVSYGAATHYAQTTFDLFYLTTIFMIVLCVSNVLTRTLFEI